MLAIGRSTCTCTLLPSLPTFRTSACCAVHMTSSAGHADIFFSSSSLYIFLGGFAATSACTRVAGRCLACAFFFFLCMYVCVYLSGVYEYVCCQCLGPRYGVRTGEVLFSSLRGCECALFSSFIFSLSLFFFLPDSFFNTRLFFAQPPRPSSSALCTACRLATPASTYA